MWVTVIFSQSAIQREAVRNFAFAYRISMAEVFRVSIEMFLDYQNTDKSKLSVVKHYYIRKMPVLIQVKIVLDPVIPYKKPIDYHFTES